ncbi:MAG: DUF1285 domain-containing protein [Rhizobiales bacterium]|nr:DUF1285 domain-containing protein [Hyphomicrobiales bacterium]
MQDTEDTPPVRGLDELGPENPGKLPPVHLWHPDNCRDIDMHIDREGRWFYMGSPIGRERMVRLFSSILRHDDDDRYYLVTPVEKCGIKVEDVPFVATGLKVSGGKQSQVVQFTTNVDDTVTVGQSTPLRFARSNEAGGYIPYVTVRDRLEARINRAVFYDLVDLGRVQSVDDTDWFGIWAGGQFWQVAPAAEIGVV